MTSMPIHGTLSGLNKGTLALSVDDVCKKGMSVNFNQLA
jgi:hypothetical protein